MAKNILDIDDHYISYPKDQWGGTDLNNPDMINPWLDIQEIVNPKKVIEIGMWAGHSALVMMTVFKNLQSLVSYDPGMISLRNAKQIKKFWPQHTFYQNAIWGHEEIHQDIDLIFIDGSHHYHNVKRDVNSCRIIKPKYLLFDNIESPDVCSLLKRELGIFNVKYEPHYWFYTNTKYSKARKCLSTTPGIMGLYKMEGHYDTF